MKELENNMENEFVSYNQALALKELGFDEPCFGRWLVVTEWEKPTGEIKLQLNVKVEEWDKNQCLAPTFSQAFRWFREKYGLIGQPMPLCISYPGKVTHYGWSIVSNQNSIDWENEDNGFKIYEEAESACLDKLIELVKK